MKKNKLKIWLADLVHTNVSVLDVVPLNLGCLASALQQEFGNLVEIKLFKYPDKLIKEIKKLKPDILALSNYTWNFRLSLHLAQIAKKINPKILVVMGGPNIRTDPENIADFLKKNQEVDVYLPLEAEKSFCLLVRQLLQYRFSSINDLYKKTKEIPGCFLSVKNYRFSSFPCHQADALTKFSSPYLKGILDEFIKDPRFIPLFETNRGCPYGCTYCAWGISALNKLRMKDLEQVKKEFNYVARNGVGQKYWYFADSNFGINEHDLELASELKKIREKFGYPERLNISWSKNSGNRLLEIAKLLKGMVPSQVAVQSLDENVLKKINRVNLNKKEMADLIKEFHKQKSDVSTDILIGCSGEDLNSHLNTLREAFFLGFDEFNINNIRMLPGSKMETASERKKYGFLTKYRLIPNSYGVYDGKFIFEIEEAIKASNTLNETEMNWLKKIHFLIYLLWTSSFAKLLLKVGLEYGLNPLDVILKIEDDKKSQLSIDLLLPLAKEYEKEWFNSEEEILSFYSRPEIYQGILSGNIVFEKLTWKYISKCLNEKEIVIEIIKKVSRIINENISIEPGLLEIVEKISLDRLRLNLTDPLSKKIYYKTKENIFLKIRDLGLVPSSVHFNQTYFKIDYFFKPENQESLVDILKRFNYEEKPLTALCAALSNHMLPFFVYTVVD